MHFRVEFRAFVLGRVSLTLSPYARAGAPTSEASSDEWDGARAVMAQLLADDRVARPLGVVVDVGLSERGWCIVEANPAWGSALYGCNPADALRAITASCAP